MKYRYRVIILTFVLLLSNVVIAYASKEDVINDFIRDNIVITENGLKYKDSTIKSAVRETPDTEYNRAVVLSDGKTVVYYSANSIDTLYEKAERYNTSKEVGDKLSDITEGLSISADTKGASTMLVGFKPIIELILGVILVVIIFLMAIYTTFDIFYIAFPLFRNKTEQLKYSQNPMIAGKTSTGEAKVRWVTDDAIFAIQKATVESGKNPWGVYLGKRLVSYVLLSVAIYILLSNNITLIVDIALNLVQGIMDILSGLAN